MLSIRLERNILGKFPENSRIVEFSEIWIIHPKIPAPPGAKSNEPETFGEKLSRELRLLPLTSIRSDKDIPWRFYHLTGLINCVYKRFIRCRNSINSEKINSEKIRVPDGIWIHDLPCSNLWSTGDSFCCLIFVYGWCGHLTELLTTNQKRQRCTSDDKGWWRHSSRCLHAKGDTLPLTRRGYISMRVNQPVSLVTSIRRRSKYGLMSERTALFEPIVSAVFEVKYRAF